jgi:hypothetical protein
MEAGLKVLSGSGLKVSGIENKELRSLKEMIAKM